MATILVSQVVQAQDFLITIDSIALKTRILEINENEVKYKDYENLDGPIYTMNKSKIDKIVYQNGKVEFYRPQPMINTKITPNLSPNLIPFEELMKMNDYKKEAYFSTISSINIYEKFKRGNQLTIKGRKLLESGVLITVGGGVFFTVGIIIMSYENIEGLYIYLLGSAALTVGQVLTIVSIPFSAIGGGLKRSAENQYRDFFTGRTYTTYQPQLNFGLTHNGIGLSLRF